MVSLSRHCLCARLTSGILNGKRIKSLRIHKICREYFIVEAPMLHVMNDSAAQLDHIVLFIRIDKVRQCMYPDVTEGTQPNEFRQHSKIKIDV